MARKKSTMKDPSAAMANNGRMPMGSSAYSLADAPSRTEFNTGMLVKKAGGGVGRPETATAAKKQPVSQDRLGPRFAIGVKMPGPVAPEASLTQSNTLMRPSINRSQPNFNLGMMG